MSSSTSGSEAAGTGGAGELFELFVRLSSGSRLRLRGNGLAADSTVADAKAAIGALLPDAPVGSQRLIYKGRILDDDAAGLSSFGIVHQSTLFLVVSRGTTATASGAPASSGPAATAATTTATAAASPTGAAAAAAPPASARDAPSSSAPSPSASDRLQQLLLQGAMSQQQQQQQQQQPPPAGFPTRVPPGPATGGLMEPWMQRLVQDMDPAVLANLLRSQLEANPALQRLMDQNPQLRHMMTDPAALQQAANMMRNPEAMQQAMRQQDLALSQLENMPGGFAALSSMYSDMQAPLEESLVSSRQEASSSSASSSSAPPSSQLADEGAAGAAMPNPWGSSSARGAASDPGRVAPGAPRNPFLDMLSASSRGVGGGGSVGGAPPLPSGPLSPPFSYGQPGSLGGAAAAAAANNPWAGLGGDSGTAGAPSGFGSMRPALGGSGGPGQQGPDPLLRLALQVAREHPDQLREAIRSNPSYRAIFGESQSPEEFNRLLEMALNPAVLEMMQQFQGLGGAAPNGFSSFPSISPGDLSALMGAANPRNPTGMAAGQAPPPIGGGGPGLDFSSLLRGMPGGVGTGAAAAAAANPWSLPGAPLGQAQPPSLPSSDPRDRYRRQLQQLAEMGFDREGPCLEALQAEHGNLNRAVDRLLSSPPVAAAPEVHGAAAPTSSPTGPTVDADADAPSSQGGGDNAAADGDHEPPAPPKGAADKKND